MSYDDDNCEYYPFEVSHRNRYDVVEQQAIMAKNAEQAIMQYLSTRHGFADRCEWSVKAKRVRHY